MDDSYDKRRGSQKNVWVKDIDVMNKKKSLKTLFIV